MMKSYKITIWDDIDEREALRKMMTGCNAFVFPCLVHLYKGGEEKSFYVEESNIKNGGLIILNWNAETATAYL